MKKVKLKLKEKEKSEKPIIPIPCSTCGKFSCGGGCFF